MLQKLEKTLFFIFLILIPFQIRMFLVNSSPKSLSAIGLSEWNSIFVYLGDVVLFLIFVLFIIRTLKTKQSLISKSESLKRHWLLIIFLIIAFISIFVSSATRVSAFRWLKLVEFVMLFVYMTINYGPKAPRVLGPRTNILKILVLGGVFQAILAIAQFIKQGSIGIKFIEAGTLNPNSPGVANFILNGAKIMRSYGSFSHPNVLSAFILLAIFCVYGLLIGSRFEVRSFTFLLSLPILIAGLFLTFSRGTIMVFLLGSMMMFLIEFFKLRKLEHTEQRLKDGKNLTKIFVLFFVSCLLVIMVLFPYVKARFFTISLQEQAIDLRFFYNRMALSMIKEKPILGIGIGNFVNYSHNYSIFLRAAANVAGVDPNQIPEWIFQPEHNIYLLIASEIGILGLIVFLIFLATNCIKMLRKVNPLVVLFFGFLIMALSDHYFWTLQAGGVIFWLALGLTRIND